MKLVPLIQLESKQPPMDTLTGSSCPPPNASNESAKAVSPLSASPIVVLLRKKKEEEEENKPQAENQSKKSDSFPVPWLQL